MVLRLFERRDTSETAQQVILAGDKNPKLVARTPNMQSFKHIFIQSSSIASYGISDNPCCLSFRLLLNFPWISLQLTISCSPSKYDRQTLMHIAIQT